MEFGSGEIQGSLDITLSHGITYRVRKPNPSLAAKLNNNDGTLNYKRGLVSKHVPSSPPTLMSEPIPSAAFLPGHGLPRLREPERGHGTNAAVQ